MKRGFYGKVALLFGAVFGAGLTVMGEVTQLPDRKINPNIHFDLRAFNGTYQLSKLDGKSLKGCFLDKFGAEEERVIIEYNTNANDREGVYHPSVVIEGSSVFNYINQGKLLIENRGKPFGGEDYASCITSFVATDLSHAVNNCEEPVSYGGARENEKPIKNTYEVRTFTRPVNSDGLRTLYMERIEEFVPAEANPQPARTTKEIRLMELDPNGEDLRAIVREEIAVKGAPPQTFFKNCSYQRVKY